MDSPNGITLHDAKLFSQEGLLKDSCIIIEQSKQSAYQAVNETLIKRNWLLGMRIQHEVLKEQRAEYGEQVIKKLAADLVKRYGRGFSKSNLYLFVSFYVSHPDFFQSLTGKSKVVIDENIFLFFSYFYLLIFYTSPRQWGLRGYLLFAKVES